MKVSIAMTNGKGNRDDEDKHFHVDYRMSFDVYASLPFGYSGVSVPT